MVHSGISIDPDRPLTRRAMLLSTVVVPVLVAACDAASPPGPAVGGVAPTTSVPPVLDGAALADHVLRRATFGITPEARDDIIATGIDAWLDRQLDPSAIDDSVVEERLAGLSTLTMEPAEIRSTYENGRGLVIGELTVARLVRAIHSERQLLEVMVGFWTDHFNIDMAVGPIVYLKGTDEREVIRPHALGRFADLLAAAVASPAMLRYLDNASSRADGDNVPNENLARELLELHTVGVDGGYDEDDVVEVAHVLSGWTIDRRTGRMIFLDAWHSMDGVTEVLGWRPEGRSGRAAGVSLLEHLARLPQTAEHLATKLCRRFVADEPPASLVERAAAAYLEHDTEIAPVVRLILTSEEFAAAASTKTRRPFELLAAQGRALGLGLRRPVRVPAGAADPADPAPPRRAALHVAVARRSARCRPPVAQCGHDAPAVERHAHPDRGRAARDDDRSGAAPTGRRRRCRRIPRAVGVLPRHRDRPDDRRGMPGPAGPRPAGRTPARSVRRRACRSGCPRPDRPRGPSPLNEERSPCPHPITPSSASSSAGRWTA